MDESNRYLLCRRRSKVVISSAKPEDSGRYECIAESTSGHRASLAAQLLVAHDTRIPETSEYPPSLFLSSFTIFVLYSLYFFLLIHLVFHLFEESAESEQKESVCQREKDVYLLFISHYKSIYIYVKLSFRATISLIKKYRRNTV